MPNGMGCGRGAAESSRPLSRLATQPHNNWITRYFELKKDSQPVMDTLLRKPQLRGKKRALPIRAHFSMNSTIIRLFSMPTLTFLLVPLEEQTISPRCIWSHTTHDENMTVRCMEGDPNKYAKTSATPPRSRESRAASRGQGFKPQREALWEVLANESRCFPIGGHCHPISVMECGDFTQKMVIPNDF